MSRTRRKEWWRRGWLATPTHRIVFGTAVGLVLVAVILTAVGITRHQRDTGEGTLPIGDDAAAVVAVEVVRVEPDPGAFQIEVEILVGGAIPDGGATLLTTWPELALVPLPPTGSDPAGDSVLDKVDAGDVTDYPLDRYTDTVRLTAVAGTQDDLHGTLEAIRTGQMDTLPVAVATEDDAAGYTVRFTQSTEEQFLTVRIHADRTGWVQVFGLAMMAVFWLLAASLLAVTIAVVTRQRRYEIRELQWGAALILSIAAFRFAAPGDPPLGTFMDFGAFFWAAALACLCLVVLVVFFLVDRGQEIPH